MVESKILLLDTSFSAKPIYDYLVSTGAEVYVLGGNPNDALAKFVDNYINLNYVNVDEVKSQIKKLGIDFLVPGGNDFSYKVCSEINQEFDFYNIDPVEVNQTINDKEKFGKFAYKIELHVPRLFENIDDAKNNLPVIVKPADAYSGHGTAVVDGNENNDLENAVKTAKEFSKTGTYLIEEFVKGQLYSHSAFIVNGEVLIDFIVEEHCIVNKFAVDTSRVIFDFDENILNQIRKDITKLADKLSLPDGLIHTQFICDDNNFWLIEITRRCPGDLYSRLIQESTGFPYAEFYAKPFLNIKNELKNFQLNKKNVIRHTVTQDHKSNYNLIKFLHPFDNLEFIPLSSTGDEIRESPFSRIGIIFVFSNNEADSQLLFKKFIKRNLYEIL
ncbi:MAG: ATP-grasp domain-containing protein [Ignavibacteria bacterium]|jgi:carbamoylphosphate synthase large subunit